MVKNTTVFPENFVPVIDEQKVANQLWKMERENILQENNSILKIDPKLTTINDLFNTEQKILDISVNQTYLDDEKILGRYCRLYAHDYPMIIRISRRQNIIVINIIIN